MTTLSALGLFHTYAVPFGSVRFRLQPKTNETLSHIHGSHTVHIRFCVFFRTGSVVIMERSQVVVMLFLYRRIKKRRRNTRIHWEHPLITLRLEFGAFYTIFPKLREHEDKFFNYFRMSTKSFDELHVKLKDRLQRQDTFMRECIPPIQMLAVTLR